MRARVRQGQHRVIRDGTLVVNHVNIEGARAPAHQALAVMRRLHRVAQLQQLVGAQLGRHLNHGIHVVRLTLRPTHRSGTVQRRDPQDAHARLPKVDDGTLNGALALTQV